MGQCLAFLRVSINVGSSYTPFTLQISITENELLPPLQEMQAGELVLLWECHQKFNLKSASAATLLLQSATPL